MTIEIRPLTRADHAAWLPLWRGDQTFYEVDLTEEVSITTFARLLDPGEPMHGALAWDGGSAIGLVHLVRHRSCWTIEDYCYLQDLFVGSDRRGGGIGRKLIAYAEDWARAEGCSRIHWLTQETNFAAMKLYDKVADRSGFVQLSQAVPAALIGSSR